MKRFALLAAAAMLTTVLGCGGDGFMDITGKVTLDGKPLERGRIEFTPSSDSGGGPIEAADIIDGAYQARPMSGKKTVRISGGKLIGQHPFSPEPGAPMVDDIEELVGPEYNTNTTLQCDITSGQATYDFELKSSTP